MGVIPFAVADRVCNPVRMSREHRSEARSMRAVLHPASVAVIGASRRSDTVGRAFLEHIVAGGYTGALYAVNNRAEPGTDIGGLPSHASVRDIDVGMMAGARARPRNSKPSGTVASGAMPDSQVRVVMEWP